MPAPAPAAAPRVGGPSHQQAPVVLVSPSVKAVAGSMGGLVEACCLQPIDTIKTRIQLDTAGRYGGVLHCGRTIAREEGAAALWKGVAPFATHLTCKYFMRMGTNATYQGLLRDRNGHLSDGRRLLAGFGAGVTEALLIVTPFEVVKIKLQNQRGGAGSAQKYRGTVQTFRTILGEEGVAGLYRGCAPTILRNGTNQMCLFWAKNNMDKSLWGKREGDGRVLAPWQSMTSGFLAAILGPLCTNPFDIVKTRLMAQEKAPAGQTAAYRGFLHCLVTVPRQEGVLALWKGLTPRLLRIPPGQAIVWAVSDQVVGFFEKNR